MQEDLHELNELMMSIQEEGTLSEDAARKAAALKKNFLYRFLEQQGSRTAHWLILTSQQVISIWLNDLYELRKKRQKRNRVMEEVEIKLASFIDFMYRRFPGYFNLQETMPYSIWEQKEEELAVLWKRFSDNHRESIDPTLVTLVLSVYHKCLDENAAPTFYEYEYFTRLWRILPTDLPGVVPDINESLVQTLIRHNFNHPDVVATIIQRLAKLTEASNSNIVFWVEQFRYFSQIAQLHKSGLIQDALPCKKQILIAIKKEMAISEQLQKQHHRLELEQQLTEPIATDLTSGQLALLIRLKIETGLYKTDNITETLKKMGQQYLNRHNERITAETLRTKYYSPDTASIKIIHNRLMNMMAQLKQM